MGNLAFTWKYQGRHTDAVTSMEDCAQTRQRVLGAGHPDTLSLQLLEVDFANYIPTSLTDLNLTRLVKQDSVPTE